MDEQTKKIKSFLDSPVGADFKNWLIAEFNKLNTLPTLDISVPNEIVGQATKAKQIARDYLAEILSDVLTIEKAEPKQKDDRDKFYSL